LLGGPSITSHVPVAAGTRVLPRSLRKPATAASPPAESASTEAALTRLALPALPSCAARRSLHFKSCVRVIFGNFSFATLCEVLRAESWAILFMIVYGNARLRRQPKLCLRNKKQFLRDQDWEAPTGVCAGSTPIVVASICSPVIGPR